jgi:hypothetical protein
MERVVTTRYLASNGAAFDTAEAAAEYEWTQARYDEMDKLSWLVWQTGGGLWSVKCDNCGRRTVREYSDDYVWCLRCQYACWNSHGHTPDDDTPDVCWVCGGDIPGSPHLHE